MALDDVPAELVPEPERPLEVHPPRRPPRRWRPARTLVRAWVSAETSTSNQAPSPPGRGRPRSGRCRRRRSRRRARSTPGRRRQRMRARRSPRSSSRSIGADVGDDAGEHAARSCPRGPVLARGAGSGKPRSRQASPRGSVHLRSGLSRRKIAKFTDKSRTRQRRDEAIDAGNAERAARMCARAHVRGERLAGCTLPRSGPTAGEIRAAGDAPEYGMHIVNVTPPIAAASRFVRDPRLRRRSPRRRRGVGRHDQPRRHRLGARSGRTSMPGCSPASGRR